MGGEDTDAMVYFRTPLGKAIQKTQKTDYGLMYSMTDSTQDTGRRGEALAAEYLRERKFQIREQNVRFGRFELDIVAYDPQEDMIVFVEVKTRTSFDERYPIRTAVNRRKRHAIQQGIFRWTLHHQYEGPARIDVICIAEGRIVEHLVNIGADFY